MLPRSTVKGAALTLSSHAHLPPPPELLRSAAPMDVQIDHTSTPDIWAEADAALFERELERGDASGDFQTGSLEREADHALATMFDLPDGDVHLCRRGCAYTSITADGCHVCEISGIEYGPVATRVDHSTGRSMWNCDPDLQNHGPIGGTWRRRPDMYAASHAAFVSAHLFDDSEMPPALVPQTTADPSCTRAARCVDAVEEDGQAVRKRAKSQKRNTLTSEGRGTLYTDAQLLFERLLAISRHAIRALPQAAAEAPPKARTRTVDARLLDERKLYEASVRKYVRERVHKGDMPSLDALHNLAMAVRDIVCAEKQKQQQAEAAQVTTDMHVAPLVNTHTFKSSVCKLIVCLWIDSQNTTYFETRRRGSDSFRSFAAGVLYAMKRGLTTPSGSLIVPPVPEFAAALPSARAITASDPAIRSLHAASHRGLCSLHRTIASIPASEAEHIYAHAIVLAKELAATCASYHKKMTGA